MPKIPRTLKIGPHEYRVELHYASNMGDDIGQCHADVHLIVLARHLPPGKKREVLWHEVTHAIHDVVGIIGETHSDEAWINATVPTQLQVLRENPSLVAYLIAQ